MNYFLNPHLFLLLENEGVLVWDYKNHTQHLLDKEHFSTLKRISQKQSLENVSSDVLNALEEAELISTSPYKESEEWGWDILSKIFHIGTQNVYTPPDELNEKTLSENYITECSKLVDNTPPLFTEKEGPTIELPAPDLELLNNVSLLTTLKNRKTCRNFSSKPMTLENLSTLLFASFGLIHGKTWTESTNSNLQIIGIRKAAPASGGLHSEEIYIAAYRVTGLKPGIYHYQPLNHQLTEIQVGDYENEIISINYEQYFSRGLACGFYITSRLDKLWWKYKHSRGLKVTLLDLGHVSQTFLLTATALGLQTWITGAFEEKKVHDLLQLEDMSESPFLFLGAGYGTGQAIPNTMQTF